MCKNAGGVEYPSPERFLAAIGVKGVEVAEVGGYETNSVFSAHTATTWAPTSMWPTEKSILQTATATSDDGEVRFTGTEVVTGSGVEAKITVEASAESGSAALSAVNSASTGERVRVVGAAFAAVVMAGVVAVL
jgi:hypothetical protein